ncbi:MAG: TIGR02221 family CRISPR-associated protein [Armatimonadetes bacterium]|nr:TIGR02221 family CRISPR-associated protein [Armatimonadota bacterium]
MKLITFLGTTDYHQVNYRWNDQTYEATFVQEAFVHWLKPEVTCVLLTEEARAKHWDKLSQKLQGHTQTIEIDIPDSKSEAKLWQIFTAISNAVHEGDEIAFDITHSFRSLPMIALLTIAYLKQVKGVKVQYVLYGAYEARDDRGAPVFDLTPFADLLDWLAAAKMFMATGNSSELGQLIKDVQDAAHRNKSAYTENLPLALKNFGAALEEVSDDLLLARVPNLPKSVNNLIEKQKRARSEVSQWTPPLTLLLDKIAAAYAPFQDDSLPTQAALIRWYLDQNHIVQAMTLAREWVVSYHLHKEGKDWRDAKERKRMEDQLNINKALKEARLWSEIITIRNDLAHCGFGRAEGQVRSAASIRQNAEEVVKQIEQLAQQMAGQ